MWLVLAGHISPSSWHTPPCPPSSRRPTGGTPVIEDATKFCGGLTHTHTHTCSHTLELCFWRNKNKDDKIVLLAEWDEAFTYSQSVRLFNELEITTLYILRSRRKFTSCVDWWTYRWVKEIYVEDKKARKFIHSFIYSRIHLFTHSSEKSIWRC